MHRRLPPPFTLVVDDKSGRERFALVLSTRRLDDDTLSLDRPRRHTKRTRVDDAFTSERERDTLPMRPLLIRTSAARLRSRFCPGVARAAILDRARSTDRGDVGANDAARGTSRSLPPPTRG